MLAILASLYVYGTMKPYCPHPEKPCMRFNLLLGGDFSGEVARLEVLHATHGLPRRKGELPRFQEEQRQQQMPARVAPTQAQPWRAMRPFAPMKKVTASLRKYSGLCSRKKFLVLEGASGVG